LQKNKKALKLNASRQLYQDYCLYYGGGEGS